jgi:sugar lactone lactonase YvrE
MKAEQFVDGLYFGEDPRWHDGRLFLSDFYRHAVLTVDADGTVEEVLAVPEQPSGLGWLPDGRLLVVSMKDRRVLRREPDGTVVEHADLSHLATWHCNDMLVDDAGRAYVGNFGFDLDELERSGGTTVQACNTVLARVDPDSSTHVAADDMAFPNGMAITPDGSTLIVAESMGMRLTAFDHDAGDGTLTNRRVWAETAGRFPDGICLDAAGCVWIASAAKPECVRYAEGGEVLDVVETSQPCYACALGGDDGRTLFCITAPTSNADVASAAPNGRIEVATVDVPVA